MCVLLLSKQVTYRRWCVPSALLVEWKEFIYITVMCCSCPKGMDSCNNKVCCCFNMGSNWDFVSSLYFLFVFAVGVIIHNHQDTLVPASVENNSMGALNSHSRQSKFSFLMLYNHGYMNWGSALVGDNNWMLLVYSVQLFLCTIRIFKWLDRCLQS